MQASLDDLAWHALPLTVKWHLRLEVCRRWAWRGTVSPSGRCIFGRKQTSSEQLKQFNLKMKPSAPQRVRILHPKE